MKSVLNICGAVTLATLGILAFGQSSTEFTSLAVPSAVSKARAFTANERHLQDATLGALCANSAFVHGYRHGYDGGFHIGDLDVHMGRDARVVNKLKEYQSSREYHLAFGSKRLFQDGYQAGFRAGYDDAISGREFRATARMRALSAGVEVLPTNRRSFFDDGFASGFNTARLRNAPKERVTPEYVEQYCRKNLSTPYPLEYCSGFGRGYLLGIPEIPHAQSTFASSQLGSR